MLRENERVRSVCACVCVCVRAVFRVVSRRGGRRSICVGNVEGGKVSFVEGQGDEERGKKHCRRMLSLLFISLEVVLLAGHLVSQR